MTEGGEANDNTLSFAFLQMGISPEYIKEKAKELGVDVQKYTQTEDILEEIRRKKIPHIPKEEGKALIEIARILGVIQPFSGPAYDYKYEDNDTLFNLNQTFNTKSEVLDYYLNRILPHTGNNRAVIVSSKLTAGHILNLLYIIPEPEGGILVHDPFGYKKSNQKGYVYYNQGKRVDKRNPRNREAGVLAFYNWQDVLDMQIGVNKSGLQVLKLRRCTPPSPGALFNVRSNFTGL